MKDERVVLGCTLLALVARLIAVRSFTANLLDAVPPLMPGRAFRPPIFSICFCQSKTGSFANRKEDHWGHVAK
ncbi:MAG: hypothetical protein KKA73_11745, partial [Chloroflexi bacterium]|nr:hypothetical protein [Chloroflexota bacterium]